MGGCADREDKFSKGRKISDLNNLEEFEKDLARQASYKSKDDPEKKIILDKRKKNIERQVRLMQHKSTNNLYKIETKNDAIIDRMPKSPSSRFSVELQSESKLTLISPTKKHHKIWLDHCGSVLVQKERLSIPHVSTLSKSKNFVDHCDSISVTKKSDSKSKFDKILIDRCNGVSVKPQKKTLKISSVSSESIFPTEPKNSIIEFLVEKRPFSPEPESTKISFKSTNLPRLRIEKLKKIPKLPGKDIPSKEKIRKSLSIQTSNLGILSPTPRRMSETELEFQETNLIEPHSNPVIFEEQNKLLVDLKSPLSPIFTVDFSQIDYSSTEESLRRSSTDLCSDYNKSSYRKATDNREFITKSFTRLSIDSIPEEPIQRSSLKKLSSNVSKLNLNQIKERASKNASKYLRRVQTLNEF